MSADDGDGHVTDIGQDQQQREQYFVPHVEAPASSVMVAVEDVPRVTRARGSRGVASAEASTDEPAVPPRERGTSTATWPLFVGPAGSGGATLGAVALLAGAPAVISGVVIVVGVAMAIAALVVAFR